MESFGEKIREFRKKFKMTQTELASQIGVSSSTIGMYEQNRRKPNFKILKKMCDVFSTQADYLISENEPFFDLIEESKNFISKLNKCVIYSNDKKINRELTKHSRAIMKNAAEKAVVEIYKKMLL